MMAGLAAGAGAAGAASSGALTTLTLITKAAAPIFAGIAQQQQMRAVEQQAERNAMIGETRAIQSDTVARQEMESDLGSARAAFTANAQAPNVGTLAMLNQIRETRGRERRIQYGAHMQQAEDYRTQASNARMQASMSLPLAFAKAGPSIFSLYEHLR